MNISNSSSSLAFFAILAASVLWGTTGVAATFAPSVGPLAIGAAAMGIGGLLQAAIATKAIVGQRARLSAFKSLLALGAISVFIYPLAFYASMHLAGVAVGTVVSLGSAPLASALIERFFEGQRLSGRWKIGASLGVLGAILICLAEDAAHKPVVEAVGISAENALYGILLGLVAGLTYALYSWAARQMMHKGIAPRAAMGSIFGLGGLMLLPVLFLTGGALLESWDNAWVGIYMALIPMFLGYVLFGYGLSRIPASMATTITLTEPVVAALLAVIIVGERLPLMGWLGIVLIAGCLVVLTLPMKKSV